MFGFLTSGVMDSAVKTAIQAGITQLTGLVSEMYGIIIPAVIGVVVIGAGAMFALRKVRGLLSWA